MNSFRSSTEIMMIIEHVIGKIEEVIDSIQTSKKLPQFLAMETNEFVYEIAYPFAMAWENKRNLREQDWREVPRIAKDCLMPKDVGKDSPSDDGRKSSLKTSTLNLKQFSSRSKKSLLSEPRALKSLSLTQRRSNRNAKQNDPKLQQLKLQQEEEDPQILKLRVRNEIRLQYDNQYLKMNMARQKSFHEKSQFIEQVSGEGPNASITHDYEGQQLKSVIADDKIKHYMMRAQFGPLAKKRDQGLIAEVSVVEVSRNFKDKQSANRAVKAMEMPLFPVQPKDFSTLHEVKHYKLHDYRKHFGRKYSRLDYQYNQTIDLSSTKDKEQHRDEIFSERRHLRDSSSVMETSRQTIAVSHMPTRRLALPRLHGRYKVLDRYQQP